MHALRLGVCSACRHELLLTHSPWPRTFQSSAALSRIATKTKPSKYNASSKPRRDSFTGHRPSHHRPGGPSRDQPQPQLVERSITVEDVRDILRRDVVRWATHSIAKLNTWGIEPEIATPLLREFIRLVKAGQLFTDEAEKKTGQLKRVLAKLDDVGMGTGSPYDGALYSGFLRWAATHPVPALKSATVKIAHLYNALDLLHPAELYPLARSYKRRVIMHVGPTNSGKTHGALTALASAPIGMYAGPLRLLAHEVWRRLNDGLIAPAGNAPVGPGVRYPRECNLVTGEEVKVIAEYAGLTSCTVEMTNVGIQYDVAVIDEIQMLGDPERGGAWTHALLGLCARELHLCGEETAVDVVKAVLKETGDDLEVRRYTRLTPLTVSPSVDQQVTKIEKGDCVVAFSRTNILDVKRRIEKDTKLKCTLAYGRLPPEVRSEQAALFNDPDSGYEVMVGSDAIGMGLNLKIKRIIFHSLYKFDGVKEVLLSNSQIKQIAGRAGRFGMGSDGGQVTTYNPHELPDLRAALASPFPSQTTIRLTFTDPIVSGVFAALPEGTTMSTLLDILTNGIATRPPYAFQDLRMFAKAAQFVDSTIGRRPLWEKLMFMMAPAAWREDRTVAAMIRMMNVYNLKGEVPIDEVMGKPWLDALNEVKTKLAERKRAQEEKANGKPCVQIPPLTVGWAGQMLIMLESIDKLVTTYLWLTFRHNLAFPHQEQATKMRAEVQRGIDECLSIISRAESYSTRSSKVVLRAQTEAAAKAKIKEDLDTVSMTIPTTLHNIQPSTNP